MEKIEGGKDQSLFPRLKLCEMCSSVLQSSVRWKVVQCLAAVWLRSLSMIFTGINQRKQEPLQEIKLSKQKKIQSYQYWTHSDLSPFLQLKRLQLFQHKKDLRKRLIFKAPCQMPAGLDPSTPQKMSFPLFSPAVAPRPEDDKDRNLAL